MAGSDVVGVELGAGEEQSLVGRVRANVRDGEVDGPVADPLLVTAQPQPVGGPARRATAPEVLGDNELVGAALVHRPDFGRLPDVPPPLDGDRACRSRSRRGTGFRNRDEQDDDCGREDEHPVTRGFHGGAPFEAFPPFI